MLPVGVKVDQKGVVTDAVNSVVGVSDACAVNWKDGGIMSMARKVNIKVIFTEFIMLCSPFLLVDDYGLHETVFSLPLNIWLVRIGHGLLLILDDNVRNNKRM